MLLAKPRILSALTKKFRDQTGEIELSFCPPERPDLRSADALGGAKIIFIFGDLNCVLADAGGTVRLGLPFDARILPSH